jgi:hypothetical protein
MIANTATAPTTPPAIAAVCDDEVPPVVGPVPVEAELPMTVGVFA